MVGRSRSSSTERLYERLHSEELKKGKRQNSERRQVKSATTRTAIKVETVVSHLYQDFFTREQKLQRLRTAMKKESLKKVDYSRTNHYLAVKID